MLISFHATENVKWHLLAIVVLELLFKMSLLFIYMHTYNNLNILSHQT